MRAVTFFAFRECKFMLHAILNRILVKVATKLPPGLRLRATTLLWQWNPKRPPELFRMDDYLPRNRRHVALDIGANDGMTSLLLSRRFCKVHSFEPNAAFAEPWRSVVPSNVQLHCIALSNNSSESFLHVPVVNGREYHGWASLGTPGVDQPFESINIPVQCVTLDNLNLNEEIDFIKIDVEGHEIEVLEGAKITLARWRPWIVIETSPKTTARVCEILTSLGFERFDLEMALGISIAYSDEIYRPIEVANTRKAEVANSSGS